MTTTKENKRQPIELAIFLLIFITIYYGMHHYTFSTLIKFFSGSKNQAFFPITILFSLSYLVTIVFVKGRPNPTTKILYLIASTWMGILFLLFSWTLIFDITNFFKRIENSGLWVIIIVLFITIFSIVNALFIKIKKVKIPTKTKLNFIQLSDIHVGTIRNSRFLGRIVARTKKLKPDFVVITGDLFDGSAKLYPHMIDPINEIKVPIFFIMGNHEFYEGFQEVHDLFKTTKIKILQDESTTFKNFQIIGVDYTEDRTYIKKALADIKLLKSKYKILLNHAPVGFDDAASHNIDMMLSGHTHNGQIFPFNFFVRLFYKFPKGLHKIKEMFLYVSPGSGTWGPPMRFGSKNEITHILNKD